MALTEPIEVEATEWWEGGVAGHLCDVICCMYRARFYRYLTIGGTEFRQLACVTHADKENEFCQHCGHYLNGRQVCPKCHKSKEDEVNAD